MFEGFSQETLDFMWGIRFNNERSWFEAHKQEYLEHLYHPMKELCSQVYQDMGKAVLDRGLMSRVCRIYRDARRLYGEGPYKDHIWFSIQRPNEQFSEQPVFWFELDTEKLSYGLGYYSARAATMEKLRGRMNQNPRRYVRFLSSLAKKGEFVLEGPEYKRKREAPTAQLHEWYNKKTFSFIHEETLTEEVFSPALTTRLVSGFSHLMPLFDELVTLNSDRET